MLLQLFYGETDQQLQMQEVSLYLISEILLLEHTFFLGHWVFLAYLLL